VGAATVVTVPAYLDAASGAPMHPVARQALAAAMDDGWADPGRLHGAGRRSRLLLDAAREAVAACLGARPDEISFTANGTQALQLAVLGSLSLPRGGLDPDRSAVHTAVEHSAVLHALAAHEAGVGQVEQIGVDSWARVDVAALRAQAADPRVAAVIVQAANHEVGTRQPLELIDAGLRQDRARPATLVVDATQTLGHEPVPAVWSVLAADARSWAGPAGVGVLAVRTSARWSAPLPGDEYELGRAPGVPDVARIVAAAASLRAVVADQQSTAVRHRALVDRIRREVAQRVPDVEVLGDPHDRLPHLVTFSCLYVDGEALLRELDQLGYAVSSGSSCAATTLTPSHVLAAMGALTSGNVRISLPLDIDALQVEGFLDVLPLAVQRVRDQLGAAGL
jgi:cysteine desulfurase